MMEQMEQFSVDVNKVLDEITYNEAQAEQTQPVAAPSVHIGLPLQYGISEVLQNPNVSSDEGIAKILEGLDINAKPIECQEECASSTINNLQKSDNLLDNLDHFYTHDSLHNDKLQHKLCLGANKADSSVLTMHNNVTHKLLGTQQINDSDVMIQNNYEKNYNQPNIQSIDSNVFNNFSTFVSNTSGDLVNFDIPCDSSVIQESKQNPGLMNVTDPFTNNFLTSNTDSAEKSLIDDLLTANVDDLLEGKKENSSAPPRYQNILLPIKLDSCTLDKSKEITTSRPDQDLQFPDLITENSHMTNVFNSSKKSSILDEPEHVYENVYIGTDIPKAQEVYNIVEKVSVTKRETGIEHNYENVNFENESIDIAQCEKNKSYEHLYTGHRENILSEPNAELETTIKSMVDQFTSNKQEIQNNFAGASSSTATNTNVNTKLVFQNVQLDKSQVQNKTSKPVVGFTAIDDMSEEELNKYLADLEAEERASEHLAAAAVYENTQKDNVKENLKVVSATIQQDDEDANEAPIFESITIGELPQVSPKHLQEKAKKFPVIDYGKDNACREVSTSKANAQVKDDENVKKRKKVQEKIRKSSDNSEFSSQNCYQEGINASRREDAEEDKENGNYVSINEIQSNQSQPDSQNSEESKNSVCAKNIMSPLDNANNKNLDNKDEHLKKSSDNDKLMAFSSTPVRSTETISRFSVTRNVDVNDKIGGRSKPSHSHNRTRNSDSSAGRSVSNNDDSNKPLRPQSLNVVSTVNAPDNFSTAYSQETSDVEGDKDSGRASSPNASENSLMESGTVLGKQPPFWVPDSDAPNCMLCDIKFTVMKRRHHCRACGKVLCNKCCNMRFRLEYQNNVDSRVCIPCHQLLTKAESDNNSGDYSGFSNANNSGINSPQGRQPNPNNPMEYCSTIPPLQQLSGGLPPPPTVMVPVGVLKREGTSKQRSEGPKSVMFSDGIRPGCDLTELDTTWDWKPPAARKATTRRTVAGYMASAMSKKQNRPPLDPVTNSYIPQEPSALPPTVTIHKGQTTYHEVTDVTTLYNTLKNECEPPVMFAINRNLYAYVKIVNLNCCVNRICWNVTSKGLTCVAQDEVVFLIETLPDEKDIPKDLLVHINQIYYEATKGNTISEYGMSIHQNGNLLGSREHAGFLFIRQTLQCLQKVIVPPAPFLVGLLVHRWETPWAKVFPLRLVLRLGAEYRYYPCPLVSVRFRDAVYFEIGHTIMKVLADFRNYAYTLPKVQGLTIHMQDKTTQVRFPKNRYNQVIKGLNNSNDHVLAFASNFSIEADSHLVCMQTNSEDESTYQTQAINIQNKPRKVTGASFIVINGALKSSMGLSANSSILEDGLMVQIMPEKMEALKAALKNMQDFTIGCGRQGAPEPDEIVTITWVENDTQFNLGVKSPIDGKPMDGIPSIRVHNGINFAGTSRFIRWTEVFIIKSDDDQPFGIHYPVDINKLSESIARATCAALVKLLDLLANAGLTKIAVRTTIHPDNVGYEAGSEGARLPPIYMNSLDNELIQVLQKAVQGCEDTQTILELVFYVLETEI